MLVTCSTLSLGCDADNLKSVSFLQATARKVDNLLLFCMMDSEYVCLDCEDSLLSILGSVSGIFTLTAALMAS